MRVKDNLRVMMFSIVLAVVCAVLLVGASSLTDPRRKANEEAEKVRNFLGALEVPIPKDVTAAQLLEIYESNVRIQDLGGMKAYVYIPADTGDASPKSVAVPFEGAGVWGPMKGVIATDPDMLTIRGLRFYHQEETPGLGAEISSQKFLAQFVGKKIEDKEGKPGIRVLKPGTETDENSVQGITGATMTSDRVQLILSDLAEKISTARGAK
jgi:Na+-transporting NADH:ubiquinone oxidoreductase subunit C